MEKERNKHEASFAKGNGYYKQFWVFFIGSIAGVIIEMLWCLVTKGTIESRQGLIYGPFNLVYGFGAVLMTLGLYKLSEKRDLYIMLGGFAIGTVFEYACSLIQETLFGTVSWQYHTFPLNFNGRVNFLYSVFWGVLAVLWIKNVYPRLSRLIEKIPNKIGIPLTWVLVVFMLYNTVISSLAVYRMSERHSGLPPSNAAERYLDRRYDDAFLEKIYPNMVYVE